VETGPTQTQGKGNNPSDELTESIHAYESFKYLHYKGLVFYNNKAYLLNLVCYSQMKIFFDTPGGPQFESLDVLAIGMTRKAAALLFYQTCGIRTHSPQTSNQLY
jgi:hypothetical protein